MLMTDPTYIDDVQEWSSTVKTKMPQEYQSASVEVDNPLAI